MEGHKTLDFGAKGDCILQEIKTNMMRLLVVMFITSFYHLYTPNAQAETVEVGIQKFQFVPDDITINVGDSVRWVNKEKRQYHSVWFEELGEPEGEYFFPDESVERTFDAVGEYKYLCGPHPRMTGIVRVVQADIDTKELSEKRRAELDYIVKQDCGSCHGMLLKGGLGPAIEPSDLKRFSVEDLKAVILHGRPGTPMPPWKGIVNAQDAEWIATQLKAGGFID